MPDGTLPYGLGSVTSHGAVVGGWPKRAQWKLRTLAPDWAEGAVTVVCRFTRWVLPFLLLVAALGCVDESTKSVLLRREPPQTTSEELPLTEVPPPPDADLFEITQRLRVKSAAPIPRSASGIPPVKDVGNSDTFTVTDLQTFTRMPVIATLRTISAHAYWFVDDNLEADIPALERSAREFEARAYPTNTRIFGDTIRGGYDGDPRLTVLVTRFNGAAGYYSSPDEYPTAVHPFSNQRLMLYINGNALRPGTNAFNSVVAHELQHALHWHGDPNEDSWINEGMSTLAEELNGFFTPSVRVFERTPDVQLTHWEEEPGNNAPHYAAAHLFLRYLANHWGGYQRIKDLVTEPKDSIQGINAWLERGGYKERFGDVFKGWVIANLNTDSPDPKHHYQDLQVRVQPGKRLAEGAPVVDQVRQHAAKYVEVRPGSEAVAIAFEGQPATRLIPTDAPSGRRFWWSNRGDQINATMTREIDLSRVNQATLRFKAWFDIEKGWDYAYVTVSADGGRTWEVASGNQTSSENPLGNSYGPGYTGRSGGGEAARWVDESIDLSGYAGKKVLLRYEYVTDDAVNNNGFAVDDIEVTEAGFRDDAESDAGWDARGFLRSHNLVVQEYSVQVVLYRKSGEVLVEDLPLDGDRKGQREFCCFGVDLDRAVVAVAALAPSTTEPAPYQLTLEERKGGP